MICVNRAFICGCSLMAHRVEQAGAYLAMCVHGNPNVLTLDKGTSKLAQGNIGQHTLVQIERWDAELPPIKVMGPPPIEERPGL